MHMRGRGPDLGSGGDEDLPVRHRGTDRQVPIATPALPGSRRPLAGLPPGPPGARLPARSARDAVFRRLPPRRGTPRAPPVPPSARGVASDPLGRWP